MRILLTVLLVFSVGILQTTLVSRITIAGLKPDLMIASLVYISLFLGTRYGIWSGFFGGLFLDLYSPQRLGVNALTYTAICFFLGEVGEKVYREKAVTQFVILVAADIVHNLLYTAISGYPLGLFSRCLPSAVYTGVVGFVSLQIIRRLRR